MKITNIIDIPKFVSKYIDNIDCQLHSFCSYLLDRKVDSFNIKTETEENEVYELEYTIPKIDEMNLEVNDIEKYIHFLENNNNNNLKEKYFSPTLKGYFFNCEYKIKIRTILDSKLITTKKIDVPLKIYVSDDYFNKKNDENNKEK